MKILFMISFQVVPSTMEILSNSDISESSYSHSHVKHSNSAAGKYSPTSTSQTESKRWVYAVYFLELQPLQCDNGNIKNPNKILLNFIL